MSTLAQARALKLLLNHEDSTLAESLYGSRHDQVQAFHRLYNCPIHEGQVTTQIEHMSTERIELRLGLILEEVKELLQDGFGLEVSYIFKDGVRDCGYYSSLSDALACSREDGNFDVVGATDALADISYVCDGMAIEMGVNLDDAVDEVHASNMTKLGADGKPIYREDGKVLKGPYYTQPDISTVIRNI